MGRAQRFSGKRETAIGLGIYAAYLLVRAAVVNEPGRRRAQRNAERIVALERWLGVHAEPDLQRLVLPYTRVVHVLNLGYATLNFGLTIGYLAHLFQRRDPDFHRLRRAAAVAFAGAQPAFLLFPTAPPRSLDHMVDTIAEVSRFDLDSGPIAKLYHPLAALPSIHVAFAVVTANHYVLDAVAGAALGAGGLRIARQLQR